MNIVVGDIIRDVLEKRGMSKIEFARRLNTSNQNVHSIFKRTHFDTEQLVKIGDILEHDFFQYYRKTNDLQPQQIVSESTPIYGLKKKAKILIELELDEGEIKNMNLQEKLMNALGF